MTAIGLNQLTKRFDQTLAVDQVSLEIDQGDLFFLLGPSGCGKTTLLRMIAGLTEPTSGRIDVHGLDVTHKAVHQRDMAMVFQGYALWPHMTVKQNVAFGLTVKSRKKQFTAQEREAKVKQMMAQMQIEELASRRIHQLSGGQQQRVALARALIVQPKVLLLDEPLANLDAQLRIQMRQEIRQVCKQAGITAVYVTHDQQEAMSMADHLAVMHQGKLMQVGTPRQVYHQPVNAFVADFLGETNLLPATLEKVERETLQIACVLGEYHVPRPAGDWQEGMKITCSIRPESIIMQPVDQQPIPSAQLKHTTYLGHAAQHLLEIDEQPIKVYQLNPRQTAEPGQIWALSVDAQQIAVLREG